MKYRVKAEYDAVQWFKIGDHPAVTPGPADGFIPGKPRIETALGWVTVEPGNWIVANNQVFTDADFKDKFEPVTAAPAPTESGGTITIPAGTCTINITVN